MLFSRPMGIYKSYDIRAVWGRDWDAATARRIGVHLPALLGARRIAVGRDTRLSSPELFEALTSGITSAGCDVVDLGLCSTPMVYFATSFYGYDGSVMITASHNPPVYNGLKISRAGSVPVGYDTGLADLERLASATVQPSPAATPGRLTRQDPKPDYLPHVLRFSGPIAGLRAVADCSDGMAGVEIHEVARRAGFGLVAMYDTPDGTFPHHEPNPLEVKNLEDLRARVVAERADLGVCFDGDADRAVFVDDLGRPISPDLVTSILGRYFFRYAIPAAPAGSAVLYDVRSSRAVVEDIRALGGVPVMCKVGHSHAKKLLRETGGHFGGEFSGHYYFRDNYYCDSGMIAFLVVSTVLAREGKKLSRIVDEVRRYHGSGELNFLVEDKPAVLAKLKRRYGDGELSELDGIRIDYPTWWFNARVSNTEPYLRLVVEASGDGELRDRTAELTTLVTSAG